MISRPKLTIGIVYCLLTLIGFTSLGYADLNNGLIAYYPFNSNAIDMSGNGNHGTIYGATFVNGKFGNGLEFSDSNNTYVEVPSSSSLCPSKAVTISLWAKVYTYSTGWACLVYKAGQQPTADGFKDRSYVIWLTSNQAACLNSTPAGSDNHIYCVTAGSMYDTNKFVHFAGVVDTASHTMNIYINGKKVLSSPYAGDNIKVGDYPLRIGAPFKTLGDQSGFNGVIDEVRLYNRALSDTEIQQLAKPDISSIVCLLLMD